MTEVRREVEEPRGGEALTVFWMLTLVATIVAETVAAATAAIRFVRGAPQDGASLLAVIPQVLLFTAMFTGALCLALTPIVRRVRREPPPASVVWVAVIVGASPFVVLLLRAVFFAAPGA